jgi:WD40 repeat protein
MGGVPDWSPDGKWLYWGSHVGLLDTLGDVVRQFNLDTVIVKTNVTWSPDSKQIAEIIVEGYSEVIQVWSLGNNVQKQKAIPLPNIVSSLRFKWLSDGKRFALAGHSRDSNYQIADKLSWFIMNIDGTLLTEVSDQ